MKQLLSLAQLKRKTARTSAYAQQYVREHEGELRAEYDAETILAIEEGRGIVGFDRDISKLVRSTTSEMQTRPLSAVVYGRVDDFLDIGAHIDVRVGGYR